MTIDYIFIIVVLRFNKISSMSNPRGESVSIFPIFARIPVYLYVFVSSPDQTKNYRDLKISRHIPLDHIWKMLFVCFFEKRTREVVNL